MSIVQSTVPRRSSTPILLARLCCCNRRSAIGANFPRGKRSSSAFTIFRLTKCLARLAPTAFSTKRPHIRPNSPYSASKAASDHLVRAWHHTYGLPVVISNCSNNYGPYHFPEKLIPLTILNALEGKPLPVYGTGENVRDWLYVEDHARALLLIAERGRDGQSYNVGGNCERSNISVVRAICGLIDEFVSDSIGPRERLITFVEDRPGPRSSICDRCPENPPGARWQPQETFETGLRKTVQWYLTNRDWWERIRSNVYRGERLGVLVFHGRRIWQKSAPCRRQSRFAMLSVDAPLKDTLGSLWLGHLLRGRL